jgi:hypothetical protein
MSYGTRTILIVAVLASLVLLTLVTLLPASPHADVQSGPAAILLDVAAGDADEPSPPAPPTPLDGLRGTLKALDALILAFQKESETFTKLLEVYRHGGQPWRRLKQDIDRAWREVRGEEII